MPTDPVATAAPDTMIVGDLQTGEVYEEPLPPPMTPEEFIKATNTAARPAVPTALLGRFHQARIDPGERVPQIRCPYVATSFACGLLDDNLKHDPDDCQAYDDGGDGCAEGVPGWSPAKGCAVDALVTQGGLHGEFLFTDPNDIPTGEWFPVDVKWEGYGPDESSPVLTRREVAT